MPNQQSNMTKNSRVLQAISYKLRVFVELQNIYLYHVIFVEREFARRCTKFLKCAIGIDEVPEIAQYIDNRSVCHEIFRRYYIIQSQNHGCAIVIIYIDIIQ